MFYKEDLKKILNYAFSKNEKYQALANDDKHSFLESSLNDFYNLFFKEIKLTLPKSLKESEVEKYIEDFVLGLDNKTLDKALQNSMGVIIPQALESLDK